MNPKKLHTVESPVDSEELEHGSRVTYAGFSSFSEDVIFQLSGFYCTVLGGSADLVSPVSIAL